MSLSLSSASRGFAALALLVLVGCDSGGGSSSTPPQFTVAPVVRAGANPAAPLVASLDLQADRPSQVILEIGPVGNARRVLASAEFKTAHARVPVLGLTPAKTHEVRVILRAQNGQETAADAPLIVTTPALSPLFPTIEVTQRDDAAIQPGYTLLSIIDVLAPQNGFLAMVDTDGEVAWLFDGTVYDFTREIALTGTRFPNGNYMIIVGQTLLLEVDVFGDVVASWHGTRHEGPVPDGSIEIALDTIHHEVLPAPPGSAGDIMFLSTELREYPNYPTDEVDPTQTQPVGSVIGDVIAEMTRDGRIVKEIDLLDILDPYRMTYDTLNGFWDLDYADVAGGVEDWSHGNALIHDPSDDSYILSLRHQDCLIKVDRASGALVWILGDPGRWKAPWSTKLLMPEGRFEYSYHQHAPELTDTGLLLYDNGNGRAIPPKPPMMQGTNYSRAVEYSIDGQTVRQNWAYGGVYDSSNNFYSFFLCDANQLANGNVLVCDGGSREPGPTGLFFGRIAEVTKEEFPRVVWEIFVRDPGVTDGINVYRAEKYDGLYLTPAPAAGADE